MNEIRTITKGDLRIRSLQLNPKKRQNNTYGKGFIVGKAMSDSDWVDYERHYRLTEGRDRMNHKI